MSRVYKAKERKAFRRTILYPSITMFIVMLALVFIVDYRMNSAMGRTKITIARFEKRNENEIVFKVFDRETLILNTVYLRRDIERLKDDAVEYAEEFIGDAVEAVKQYDFKDEEKNVSLPEGDVTE